MSIHARLHLASIEEANGRVEIAGISYLLQYNENIGGIPIN